MKAHLDVEGILGAHGALEAALPSFHHREEQVAVARAVEEALAERQVLLAEAGTGTGKTLAYLVPSALSGRKVVVSTATKNLQEQIIHKDVPLLRDVLGLSFEVAYLKGRQNYLCLHRYEAAAANPRFDTPEDAKLWPSLSRWVETTQTGDRAEWEAPEDWPGWRGLTVGSESCLGHRCPSFDACFVTRARKRAEAADVVVVNHHLFFADLALKQREGARGAGVLPAYEAVIFDEAHAIEDVAADWFGSAVSSHRIEDLVRDAGVALEEKDPVRGTLLAHATRVKFHADAFFEDVRRTLGLRWEGQQRLPPGVLSELPGLPDVLDALEALSAFADGQREGGAALAGISRRAAEVSAELDALCRAEDDGQVYWAERRGRGVFLRATPIEVGEHLRRTLFAGVDTVVFTSATLTAEGRFDFFARRMGLEVPEVQSVVVNSPFDYGRQAALYVPDHLPDPNAPHFAEAVADALVELCAVTEGRAFALFTSLRNMEAAWRAAKDRLPYQVLLQGERPKSALLDAFRQTPSVLFASHSFWEGVDVPGDALSLVVIDKLPFASPGDPRVAARIDALKARGEDPFRTFQLPEAAIALRQGFGRLIRSREDRGVVAILDPRMRSRGYGKSLGRSLPPAHRVESLAELRAWWERST